MKKLIIVLALALIFTACGKEKPETPVITPNISENAVSEAEKPEEKEEEEEKTNFLTAEDYSFTEEYFKTEVLTFVSSHRGEFDFTKGGCFTAENIKHYAVTRVYQILRDGGNEITDENGELVVSEELVDDFAKCVLDIDGFSYALPGEGGFYQVPYSGRYLNAEFSKIETDGAYAVAVLDFYDLDDSERKNILWQMEYGFIPLEYNQMEIFFRPVYAKILFGEEK